MTIQKTVPKLVMLLVLALGSITLALATQLSALESFRAVFGFAFVLLLPGYVWTFVFFYNTNLGSIERLVMSIAFSVALVPLLTFIATRLGIRFSPVNLVLEIMALVILGWIIGLWQRKNHFRDFFHRVRQMRKGN